MGGERASSARDESDDGPERAAVGMWMAIGVGSGTSIGVATGTLGVCLPVGVAMGLGLEAMMARRR